MGIDREGIERELMVLLAGITVEELIYGDALGSADDLAEIDALLEGADWVANLSPPAVETYLVELKDRLKNEFNQRGKWREALELFVDELITRRKMPYKDAANLFERVIG